MQLLQGDDHVWTQVKLVPHQRNSSTIMCNDNLINRAISFTRGGWNGEFPILTCGGSYIPLNFIFAANTVLKWDYGAFNWEIVFWKNGSVCIYFCSARG